MSLTLTKWSLEDYHRMVDAGILIDRQVELLDGVIVDMPPEGEPHAYFSDRAADIIRQKLGGLVKVREAKPISIPGLASEPQPDVAIVEPLDTVYLDHHPYPENVFWLIEYSNSSLKKDLGEKRHLYANAGIPEYWVIDLKQQQLVVFRDPKSGDFQSRTEWTTGYISPLAFPKAIFSVSLFFKTSEIL